MTAATINLNGVIFSPQETVFITMGDMTASTLRYASGVAGLRIKNRVGEIIILPFLGQQVWDATFHGRRLTMRSMFEEPVDTCDYLRNYGAFLLHCGATAMGNPSAGDTHPLHGELPNARYQRAELLLGEDDEGSYMEVRGSYRHTVAFSHNYVAKPCLRIHETSSKLDLHMQISNLKNSPMDLMYLAHVNFRPVDGATLVDTAPDDPSHIRIRTHVPEFFMPTATHRVLIDSLLKDPSLHRVMERGRAIDPELVMGMDFRSDDNGMAHSLQVLPDGSADFISHRPAELKHGVRWITRTADQDALGLFLPGTAEADGYTKEKQKGNVVVIAPRAVFSCRLQFGALTATEATRLQATCNSITGKA
jgi:hypothetical protein